MQQPEGQIWNGDTDFERGKATTGPPLAMALFLLYEYGFILVCNLGFNE